MGTTQSKVHPLYGGKSRQQPGVQNDISENPSRRGATVSSTHSQRTFSRKQKWLNQPSCAHDKETSHALTKDSDEKRERPRRWHAGANRGIILSDGTTSCDARVLTAEGPRCQRHLLAACTVGDVDAVREMLFSPVSDVSHMEMDQSNGSRVPGDNDADTTALIAASRIGSTAIVTMLVSAGADVNKPAARDGTTPLIAAAAGGHLFVIDELLLRGADLRVANDFGTTPLLAAAECGSIECVDALIKAGAGVDHHNTEGATALHIASALGSADMTRSLLRAGARINATDFTGCTPLYSASFVGANDVIDLLLECSADPNVASATGATPLFIASQNGFRAVALRLIDAAADVNSTNHHGRTPLMAACRGQHRFVAETLLRAGADPRLRGQWGTAFDELKLCGDGHHDVLVALLSVADADDSACGHVQTQ